ncbi:PREDICTED: uncharacterized protein LOC109226613 [Nicotiana attenuata]|uniref:Uncharacterized protein n=1 Tax=Nicotiana attenuata TaxID=49451 RepID=A0A1J6ISD0_NICAT|nr:PREDICTED: uncharacterized protein LOC109226613 [Nicotiana attenuata]XP_019246978.1 PREDICTED: uncharacterized protein LOC109226613 [Nicotiana attenuata]OIT01731.1 hypothetical protein A4A49_28362 [Nicotiana attenuata]
MPSLKMKTKPASSSSKEKNGLHVCPNSSVISKSSLSRTRSVQNAEEVADLIHNSHDVPILYEVYPHQVGRNGDHANDLADELLEKQQPPVTDSATIDTMVNMLQGVNYYYLTFSVYVAVYSSLKLFVHFFQLFGV